MQLKRGQSTPKDRDPRKGGEDVWSVRNPDGERIDP